MPPAAAAPLIQPNRFLALTLLLSAVWETLIAKASSGLRCFALEDRQISLAVLGAGGEPLVLAVWRAREWPA